MEIYKDLIQGTPEWRKVKAGKITGTVAKTICGTKENKNGEITVSEGANTIIQKKIIELVLEKVEETIQTDAMARGCELESESRRLYEFYNDVKIEEVGFIQTSKYSGFSPDGLIGEDGLWENKSMELHNHLRAVLFDYIKPEYYYQIQKGLLDSERQWCDFTVYNPDIHPQLQFKVIRVYRDEEVIEQIQKSVELAEKLIEEGFNKYKELLKGEK